MKMGYFDSKSPVNIEISLLNICCNQNHQRIVTSGLENKPPKIVYTAFVEITFDKLTL